MTEKEYVDKAFRLSRRGTDGDRIDRDLQVISRELAIIADELKKMNSGKEANDD